jgi:RNA polymerase sigma-70 factor (ECF subfamily)
VATLLREFGAHRLAVVEDGLSQALLEATMGWRSRGVPPDARAWIHRAARHRIIDELRKQRRVEAIDAVDEVFAESAPETVLSDDVHDDELRALFACAEPSIPLASQIVFALRTLSGFSTREIATRLVTTEENVQKRWERARDGMARVDLAKEVPLAEMPARADAVLRMIYVLFTEGYFASSGETLALMHLHHARRDARADAEGLPILLEDQDRSQYRRDELALGLEAFRRAQEGGAESKYHLEAAIAAEHAFAPTFADTRWSSIVRCYDRLAQIDPSPLHTLHGAIALSYAEGPEAGLARLDTMRPPTWLAASHLWLATYADFHRRLGHAEVAKSFYEKAIALAPSFERLMLERRLALVDT